MIPLLAVLVILCQVTDFATTYRILINGGREENTIVRKLIDILGLEIALFITKFYAGIFVWAGAILGWFEGDIEFTALFALAVWYVYIAIHNLNEVN